MSAVRIAPSLVLVTVTPVACAAAGVIVARHVWPGATVASCWPGLLGVAIVTGYAGLRASVEAVGTVRDVRAWRSRRAAR